MIDPLPIPPRPTCPSGFPVGLAVLKSRLLLGALAALTAVTPILPSVSADESGEPATLIPPQGKVFGTIWTTNLPSGQLPQYRNAVRERLGIEQPPIDIMMGPAPGSVLGRLSGNLMFRRPTDDENQPLIRGQLLIMQTSPQPDILTDVNFLYVGTEEGFARAVKAATSLGGMPQEVRGEGHRLELVTKLNLSRMVRSSPPPADPGEESDGESPPVMAFSVQIVASSDGSSSPSPAEAGELPTLPSEIVEYVRYHDGIMYSSRSELIHHVDLPAMESLLPSSDQDQHDLSARIRISEIPRNLRQAFWDSLYRKAAAGLQQFDNESTATYALRRLFGESRLEILKAGLFDLDEVEIGLQLPSDTNRKANISLKLEAVDGTGTAELLRQIARRRSSLSFVRDSDAPFLCGLCLTPPEWMRPVAAAVINSMALRVAAAADRSDRLEEVLPLFENMRRALQADILDIAFRQRRQTDGNRLIEAVFRTTEAEQILDDLENIGSLLGPERIQMGTTMQDGAKVLQAAVPLPIPAGNADEVPEVHFSLTARDGRLWLAASAQQDTKAVTTLADRTIEAEEETAVTATAAPFFLQCNLHDWLSDSRNGANNAPMVLLDAAEKQIAEMTRPKFQMMSVSINGQKPQTKTGTPANSSVKLLASQALQEDGSAVRFDVQAFGRELNANLSIGQDLIDLVIGHQVLGQKEMFGDLKIMGLPDIEGGNTVRKSTIRIGR